jgi:hypothetical protein
LFDDFIPQFEKYLLMLWLPYFKGRARIFAADIHFRIAYILRIPQ